MTSGVASAADRSIRRLFGAGTLAGLGEAQLLERYARDGDPDAFEALVRRHGAMVLGVCRRMLLGDRHAADDAFQATFAVLARRAGSIRDGDRLGPWLYGVAYRVARRARAKAARQRPADQSWSADRPDPRPAVEDVEERSELFGALDDELARLPEAQRAALVLCYLDGLTIDRAAERLGIPVGTARSRLARGRDRLRRRLIRRGFDAAPALLVPLRAAWSGRPHPPLSLLKQAVAMASKPGASGTAAAVAVASRDAIILSQGVLRTMTITKWATIGTVLVPALGLGGAITSSRANIWPAVAIQRDDPAATATGVSVASPDPSPSPDPRPVRVTQRDRDDDRDRDSDDEMQARSLRDSRRATEATLRALEEQMRALARQREELLMSLDRQQAELRSQLRLLEREQEAAARELEISGRGRGAAMSLGITESDGAARASVSRLRRGRDPEIIAEAEVEEDIEEEREIEEEVEEEREIVAGRGVGLGRSASTSVGLGRSRGDREARIARELELAGAARAERLAGPRASTTERLDQFEERLARIEGRLGRFDDLERRLARLLERIESDRRPDQGF